MRRAASLALHFHRGWAAADKAGERVLGAALAREFAPHVVQVAMECGKLLDQRLERGLGMIEQHDAQGADHLPALVTQRNAAHHECAGLVRQQVDQDRLAAADHAMHLRVLHHLRHGMADEVLHAREAQRRQEALVLVVDPHHAGIAIHQQHALARVGEQVEHRPRGQLQDALAVARQAVLGRVGRGHRPILPCPAASPEPLSRRRATAAPPAPGPAAARPGSRPPAPAARATSAAAGTP